MANKINRSLKVLFMHGLESGPKGSKDQYLHSHFDRVVTPDMKISMFRLTKSNSVLRNFLRRPLFIAWTSFGIVIVLLLVYHNRLLLGLLAFFGFIGILIAIYKPLVQQALKASIAHCIQIQSAAVKDLQPDIVIGSSWGAMIALLCVSQKIYYGPLLLIAPPLKLVSDKTGDHTYWDDLCKLPQEILQKILIIHGDQDKIVPIEHSKLLAKATGIELKIIEEGDHRLHAELLGDENSSQNFLQLIEKALER